MGFGVVDFVRVHEYDMHLWYFEKFRPSCWRFCAHVAFNYAIMKLLGENKGDIDGLHWDKPSRLRLHFAIWLFYLPVSDSLRRCKFIQYSCQNSDPVVFCHFLHQCIIQCTCIRRLFYTVPMTWFYRIHLLNKIQIFLVWDKRDANALKQLETNMINSKRIRLKYDSIRQPVSLRY